MSATQSDQPNDTINIKIQYSKDGHVTFFRVKRSAKLRKLKEAFCTKHSVDPKSVEFIFDGHRVQLDKTPLQLGIEDGDEVSAMVHPSGGSMIVGS